MLVENKYPKILIIDNFNQKTANGITIYNLFSHWPEERIAVIHKEKGDYNDIAVPNVKQYFILGNNEVKYKFPFCIFLKIGASQIIGEQQNSDAIETSLRVENKGYKGRVRTFFYRTSIQIFIKLGLTFLSKKIVLSPDLERWVENFKPDYLYSSGGNVSTLRFVLDMKNKFKTKFVLHTFDDYLYCYNNSVFSNISFQKIDNLFRKAVLNADKLFVISDKMATEYEFRYGRKFHKFHNPLNQNFVSMRKQPREIQDTVFKFAYFGKVNGDVNEIISIFIDALPKNSSTTIEFHIFSQLSLKEWVKGVGKKVETHFKGSLPYREIPNVMSSYNGLLLPLSFNPDRKKYLKLSLSTKTSEYLVSGVPIFLLAPKDLAVSEYLIANKSAFIVAEISNLTQQIEKFVRQSKEREMISERAYNLAIKEHTVESVTERLIGVLNNKN